MKPALALPILLATLLAAAADRAAGAETASQPGAETRQQPVTSFSLRTELGLQSVIGVEVVNMAGDSLGHVVDVLSDPEGKVTAAVVDFGGFLGLGSRRIAVSWSQLRFLRTGKSERAMLAIPRDVLRRAPEYKPGEAAVIVDVAQ